MVISDKAVCSETEKVNDEDDNKWRKMSWLSKTAHAIKNVTVEPILGIFQLSMMLSNLTTQNLNMRKACRVNLEMDEAVCWTLEHNITNVKEYADEEKKVQQLVTGMMIWLNIVQSAIPCVLVVFIGSWSDRNRSRKPFMLIPVFGELVRSVGLIACVYFFRELSMEVTGIIESVPSSITGNLPVLMLAVFAYVGDISTIKNRTLRVGYVSLFTTICIPIGAVLSGVLFQVYGFYGVYIISTVLYLFIFVYGILVIKDVKPATEEEINESKMINDSHNKFSFRAITEFFDFKHIKDAFQVTLKRRYDDNKKADILLLLIIMVNVLGPLSGEQPLTYMMTRVKFNWTEVNFSVFSAYYFICNLIGIGCTLSVLVNRFDIDDRILGAIGCMSKGLATFVYAFAPTEFIFYLGPIVDIFHGTAFVAIRSILSKLVPANELGQVLAVFSLVETMIPVIFRPLYSAIYLNTVNWVPGAFYVLGGIMNIIGVLIFIWMYNKQNLNKKYDFTDVKQALATENQN